MTVTYADVLAVLGNTGNDELQQLAQRSGQGETRRKRFSR